MKFNKIFAIAALAITMVFSSCNFENLDVDPNRATGSPANLILNGVLNNMWENAWTLEQRYNQYWCINYNYYGTNEYWSGPASTDYTRLKNVIKMEEEALKAGAPAVNPYSALGKFFRAYHFVNMTQKLGDLPLSEALQGLDIQAPKYNTQKEIYVQVLNWLDEANNDLAALIAKGGQKAEGDWFYNGDLSKWQKLVNSYKLRVLVSLSKKETDADLKLKTRFAEVLGNPTKFPIFTGNSDNLVFIPSGSIPNFYYRKNPNNYGFDALRENTSKLYIDLLKEFQDPRLFLVAEPAEAKVKAGVSPTSFDAFEGASTGENLDDMSTKAQKGEYSLISRKRYYVTYTGEPVTQVGYQEMCFNIAEGLNRGWATGVAEDWYKKGIQASMDFYGLKAGANNVDFQKSGAKLGEFNTYTINVDFAAYLAQAKVKYVGNNADGLAQILKQKYLAMAQNSGMEAYYNWRRTGIPAFLTGVGIGNQGKIPLRFKYPNAEYVTNKANVEAAVARQSFTNDDLFGKMWIIQ
ncbi:SusD/RagB family nutrient-binding outer membrane lipoprotein [Haliscomenobacter sp.]|uniref:SusD/RagB family nutrient-binding outer membrane lipoprotein n=1 Tax=Haliscomenobacter sp. TaxID=2717303 RepID=UPI003BAA959B